MSGPDKLMKLKTTVEVYENELKEAAQAFQSLRTAAGQQSPTDAGILVAGLGRFFDINAKLVIAYREYVAELEKLVPR